MSDDKNGDIERLFSVYESSSNNFQKVFGIMIGLGLFFLLTVLLPYFLNIYEYDQNKNEIANETKSIQQANLTNKNLNEKLSTIKAKIQTFSNRADDFRDMRDSQIKKVNDSLTSADKLISTIIDNSTLATLKQKLKKAQYQLNSTLQYAGVALGSFNKSLSGYEQRNKSLGDSLEYTVKRIDKSQLVLDKAKASKVILLEKLHNLTSRWEEIQSPFGNLPIEFTNLLAIIPVGLSTGFLLCSRWLSEAIQIRKRIHAIRHCQKIEDRKERQESDKDDELSQIAPLWIDPANPKQNKILQLTILSIPVVIFIFSTSAIIYTWEHAPTPPFPAASEINKSIYYIIYALCIIFFAYGYWRIYKEIAEYKDFIRQLKLKK